MNKTTESMTTLTGSLIAHWFAMPVMALYPACAGARVLGHVAAVPVRVLRDVGVPGEG